MFLVPTVWLGAALVVAGETAEDRRVLVQDGEPAATIVISRLAMDEPEPESGFAETYPHVVWKVRDAADELQDYLHKISGARLPIVSDDQKIEGTVIAVGESRYTRELGLTSDSFSRQEYLVRAEGDRLILMGRDETYDEWIRRTPKVQWLYGGCFSPLETYQAIGTDYAVTSFLQAHCGVRWYFPGEIGEVVPRRATLSIPHGKERRKTSTRHRRISPDLIPPKYHIEKRLTENAPGSRFPAYDLSDQPHNGDAVDWGRRLKLGGDVFVSNHSLHGYFDRFAKDHPDWFADGQPARGHMVNFANRDLMQQVVRDARAFFDNDARFGGPHVGRFFSVVPMDNETWSNDPESRAIYENGGDPVPGRWPGTLRSNYVWNFVAQVAGEVAKTHPRGVITCVGYRGYMGPPSSEPLICTSYQGSRPAPPFQHVPDVTKGRLPSNVAVQLCIGYPALIRQGPREFHNWLFDEWAGKIGDPNNVYVWQYWLWPTNPSYRNFPNVNPREIGELARAMKRRGFTGGIFCQIDETGGHWWSYPALDHLRVYVMARLFENWNLDESMIMEEYYELFYGPATAPMKKFWEFLHRTPYERHPEVTHPELNEKWRAEEEKKPDDWDWTMVCPPKDLDRLGEMLRRARELVSVDSIYRKRIDLVDRAVYHAYLLRASRETLGKQRAGK
jgi:hypothetical protein